MPNRSTAPGPVQDPAVRARVTELHAQGLGRNAIASELGLGTSTITRIAKALGLDFSREQTAVAVAARVRSLKERRADIVTRLYTRAEVNLDRLEADVFETLTRGESGSEYPSTLRFVPTPAERDLQVSIAGYLGAAAKLELQDADQGASDARSLLTDLGRALGITE